jgi:hypothetical protein
VAESGFHLGPRGWRWIGGLKVRLHDDVRLLVAFLGFRTTNTAGVSVPKYGGTGFFVTYPISPDLPRLRLYYLITARHVAESLAGPFIIGITDATGASHIIDIDQANWSYHPDPNVDVAAVNLELNDNAWIVLPSENFIDESQLFKQFGVGDLVYIVGLYRLFPGDAKISPIVHTGHIAMAPNDEIPVKNRASGENRWNSRISYRGADTGRAKWVAGLYTAHQRNRHKRGGRKGCSL